MKTAILIARYKKEHFLFENTMGIRQIMQAKKILILASGTNKADAVYKMVKGGVTEDVPASILQLHSDCTLIADRDAATKIK